MGRKTRTKPSRHSGSSAGIPLWQWSAAIAMGAMLYGAYAVLTATSNSTPAEGWQGSTDAAFAAKYLAMPCEVDRYGAGELSAARFDAEYRDRKPVVFRLGEDDVSTAPLRTALGRAQLETVFGDVPTAIMGRGLDDGEPHIKEEMPLRSFLAKLRDDAGYGGYLFDSQTFLQQCRARVGWDPVSRHMDTPAPFTHFRNGGRTFFSVGGDKSGVPLHFHSAAWNLVLAGHKHWTLFGHSHTNHAAQATGNVTFDPREHHLTWLEETLPTLPAAQRPLQCVTHVGEVAYIPVCLSSARGAALVFRSLMRSHHSVVRFLPSSAPPHGLLRVLRLVGITVR